MIYFLICCIFTFWGVNEYAFSEDTAPYCTMNAASSQAGPFVPTTGTSKALIIFVQFSDDTFGSNPPTPDDGSRCTTDSATEWPYDRADIPSWGLSVIDETSSGTHSENSLTDYFCKMSRDRNDGTHGDFHLVGEVYPELVVPVHSRSWYENLANHSFSNEWIAVNREILTFVDNNPEGIDLSSFDDYKNGTTIRQSDGKFDMIILAFRFHFQPGFSGISNLDGVSNSSSTNFGSFQVDGLNIDGSFQKGSGVITNTVDHKGFVLLIAHEYAHRFYGFKGGFHFNNIGNWGLMDNGGAGQSMSAYERELLGWISPRTILGDSINLVLTESITTSDIYKVAIQNGEYFLIENRQRTFWADQDQSDGNDNCDKQLPGTGLLISHIAPNKSSYSGQLYIERANGGSPTSLGGGSSTDPFKQITQDNFTPWTIPNSTTRNSTFTDVAILDIQEQSSDITLDVTLDAPPDRPQNLYIPNRTSNGAKPVVKWDANSEPDLNHYAIYRGYKDSWPQAISWGNNPVTTTTSTSWIDNSTTINTSTTSSVHYRATAVDDADNESDYSGEDWVGSNTLPKNYFEMENVAVPNIFRVSQNHPNPFNPETKIRFELPESSQVRLIIYNVRGEHVRELNNTVLPAGFHSVIWDGKDTNGRDASSGVYVYRFEIIRASLTQKSFTGKMTLLR